MAHLYRIVAASIDRKIPIFLKEKWDGPKLPQRAPLSRLAAGHRVSGAKRP
jgi:hypothetical protein